MAPLQQCYSVVVPGQPQQQRHGQQATTITQSRSSLTALTGQHSTSPNQPCTPHPSCVSMQAPDEHRALVHSVDDSQIMRRHHSQKSRVRVVTAPTSEESLNALHSLRSHHDGFSIKVSRDSCTVGDTATDQSDC